MKMWRSTEAARPLRTAKPGVSLLAALFFAAVTPFAVQAQEHGADVRERAAGAGTAASEERSERRPALPVRPLRPRGVKGKDDRVRLIPDTYPWTAIGRLNRRTGGFCTAVVVAPKLILTAAHCLYNRRTLKNLPPQSLHFVAGYAKGEFLFHGRVVALHPAPGYDHHGKSGENRSRDWAFLSLDKDPVPVTGKIEPLAGRDWIEAALDGPALVQAGYSQDRAHILTLHDGCRLSALALKGRLLAHWCDAVPGDSGSPMMIRERGGYRLVGIHVASAKKFPHRGVAVPVANALETYKRLIKDDGPEERRR